MGLRVRIVDKIDSNNWNLFYSIDYWIGTRGEELMAR